MKRLIFIIALLIGSHSFAQTTCYVTVNGVDKLTSHPDSFGEILKIGSAILSQNPEEIEKGNVIKRTEHGFSVVHNHEFYAKLNAGAIAGMLQIQGFPSFLDKCE